MHSQQEKRFSGPRSEWGLDLEVDRGWCGLTLTDDDRTAKVWAHTLADSLTSLFDGIAQLTKGTQSVSIRWAGEVAGGTFVDLVRDPEQYVNVALHEFKYGNTAEEFATMYSAIRGECTFSARVPYSELIKSFAATARKLRVENSDRTGYIEQWGWSFPLMSHEKIEREAVKFGYKPTPTRHFA